MNPKPQVMAVYGGTFDPFHNGHEAICRAVLANPDVDQLRLIPCNIPALKADASASAFQRLEMLQAWRAQQPLADQARIYIDDIELARSGASYTVDTLSQLTKAHPTSRLVFIMGLDSWHSLERWQQSSQLQQMANFWVFARKGEPDQALNHGLIASKSCTQLLQASYGHYWFDDQVQIELSSSQVRGDIQHQQELLPLAVAQYIKERSLYGAPKR